MLDFRTGDIFDAEDLVAMGHGCNCMGAMGGGIAFQFSRRFPEMNEAYKDYCNLHDPDEIIGDFFLWEPGVDDESEEAEGMLIFNLFTQVVPGPDARLDAIVEAVDEMLVTVGNLYLMAILESATLNVGIPRIGAGIGGLAWDEVEEGLLAVCEGHPNINLVVFTLPGEFGTPKEIEEEVDTAA